MWVNKHKTLVTAGLLGMMAVTLLFLAVIPIYQSASKMLGKIQTKTKERDELVERVAILSQLDSNVLAERVRVLDSALPPKKDVLMYLASINGLSNELGLSFGGISLSPGELTEATGAAKKKTGKISGPKSLDTEIKIKGGKDNVYAFLRTIEEVLPLMQIKDIAVTISEEDQYTLALTLGMLWAEANSAEVKGPVSIFGEEEEKYFQQLAKYRTYPGLSTQILPENQEAKIDVFASPILQP
ncbi:MAG: hypothetical protein UX62_C0053G0011 [Microgenomates group bacterium GW2011_GWA2_46_7]|nr:MAG: hypothetical protein UX62_C0053G0011 [Microgenomates group bacterium GW2011_GWA2_46_7]KKU46438.1 MAG: hypothetical protein UX64_C0007G0008 [Microgenomates group bacterium GW2011_GWC2_46_7]